MGTDKPLISILMATYEPRMDWLREQLESLEAQTYPNLKLYIRDDGSSSVPFEEIQTCVKECIHSFPYVIVQNEKNMGSNLTFERLTQEAGGQFFAYCDQDDVWLPNKLQVLQEAIEQENALLVCSDMYIIDGNGRRISESITKIRHHHVFHTGTGLASELLIRNFVVGCSMLIWAKTAKSAVPFCPYMVHDHYLALWSAAKGKVLSLQEPLICYRVHGGNQTSVMAGVNSRVAYYHFRIESLQKRLGWLQQFFPGNSDLLVEISQAAEWAAARERYFMGDSSAKWMIWKYRRFGIAVSLFEIAMKKMPESLFMFFILLTRKNLI